VKVLYATMQYGRGYFQGTERYVTMLAGGLRARGHTPVVFAGDPERRGPRLALGETGPDEPEVHAIPTRGLLAVEGAPPGAWRSALEHHAPDVVHIANPAHIGIGLVDAARRVGVPVVVTTMDYWWLCPKHLLTHFEGTICDARVPWTECLRCMALSDERAWLRGVAATPGLRSVALPLLFFGRALTRGLPRAELQRWTRRQTHTLAALESADAVIFPSSSARNLIGSHLSRARTYDVPYGIDERWFTNAAAPRHEKPAAPDELVLGFAGALEPHKGPHLILAALRALGWTRTKLRLAGDGSRADYVAQLNRDAAGLNIEFAGRVDSDDMPAFLRSLDLFILSSSWPENLPIAMLEAQAVGVPVLSSAVPGAAEAIGDPAMLFEINDAGSLARQLAAWHARTDAPAPPKRVSTISEMVDRTLTIYHNCR
jgi:glycosyltransferase involved in cell wall biosynthesis